MLLARRSFLSGLASALFAPAVVRAESMMPVRAYLDPHAVPGMPGWLFMHGQELRRSEYPTLASVLEFERSELDKVTGIAGPYFQVPDSRLCVGAYGLHGSRHSMIAATAKTHYPVGTEFTRLPRVSEDSVATAIKMATEHEASHLQELKKIWQLRDNGYVLQAESRAVQIGLVDLGASELLPSRVVLPLDSMYPD